MHTLTVCDADGRETRLPVRGEPLLSELLRGYAGAPQAVCGGRGVCKKCRVRAEGALSPAPADGYCLSCQSRVTGDARVELPRRTRLSIVEDGSLPALDIDGRAEGLGLAADIGTTTVVVRLFDLKSGAPLGTASAVNPQTAFAADVIGRIGAAMEGQLALLQAQIRDCLSALTQQVCAQAQADTQAIRRRVITGNTTMLYLYHGMDPKSLSCLPFEPDERFGFTRDGCYYPPCPDAFVGADITCAVMASGMTARAETSLLIDLGTNGELALWHGGALICCATAAGPAFEGGGIQCGSGAVEGAIDAVEAAQGALRCHVLGERAAESLCGSGLIDAVAALLEMGRIDETGAMEEDTLPLCGSVVLTQRDVRQFQLAKAAIAAGIETLLQRAGLRAEEVQRLYIAGGFGQHLPIRSAVAVGMLPAALQERVTVLGNGALSGAAMLLCPKYSAEAERTVRLARCINLGADAAFSDSFIEHMLFDTEA